MTPAQLIENFNALPTDAQKVVVELVVFLGKKSRRSKPSYKSSSANLMDEKFIGLWRDRDDMQDSNAYIRSLRRSEWS